MISQHIRQTVWRATRLFHGNDGAGRMYAGRVMRDGYPQLDKLADEYFADVHARIENESERLASLLSRLARLAPIRPGAQMAIIGCGPVPQSIRLLSERGYRVTGVEPIPSFVRRANLYLGGDGSVREGSAESLPIEDESQDVVLMESVLEHVDSPRRSLGEAFRILAPGGMLYLTTTNRYRIGYPDQGEFTVALYGKLPPLVKECYVFRHLHYDPSLARYTQRPAVHWFTFADLCRRGREAGFHQFYSPLDLRRPGDPLPASPLMRFTVQRLLSQFQLNPWCRALALTQVGGAIVMLKREQANPNDR